MSNVRLRAKLSMLIKYEVNYLLRVTISTPSLVNHDEDAFHKPQNKTTHKTKAFTFSSSSLFKTNLILKLQC
ncbi:CLUMA_CG007122, isoform A [Clunio marinus]|uniref:CLUMA_CG007122, isoform A n=1 Tax=Clunio marinus TaxID=568069 RepID=A0A1J1HZY9_9DIPT|nr:CLUMA_CG007122, isoform A [Clunio marinus]